MATTISPFRTLPDDLLRRILVGVPLDDHRATASVCRAFRDVINGPKFLALRQRYGFAERGIAFFRTTGTAVAPWHKLEINIAGDAVSMSATLLSARLGSASATTDGGARLFVSTITETANEISEVNASSRRVRRFATLPLGQDCYCMEWHGGCLYVAGGRSGPGPGTRNMNGVGCDVLDSFHVFKETTGSWEYLPSMPRVTQSAGSAVIGNQLFIVGGTDGTQQNGSAIILQIYDIAARTWRLGAPLPHFYDGYTFAIDGKLVLVSRVPSCILVYDLQSDTWTRSEFPWDSRFETSSCAHNGRVVVFLSGGTAFERVSDGSWSPYAGPPPPSPRAYYMSQSVVLG